MMLAVAELDVCEMIVRMVEAMTGEPRPEGMSAKEAVEAMDEEQREAWFRGMWALKEYWDERMDDASPLQ